MQNSTTTESTSASASPTANTPAPDTRDTTVHPASRPASASAATTTSASPQPTGAARVPMGPPPLPAHLQAPSPPSSPTTSCTTTTTSTTSTSATSRSPCTPVHGARQPQPGGRGRPPGSDGGDLAVPANKGRPNPAAPPTTKRPNAYTHHFAPEPAPPPKPEGSSSDDEAPAPSSSSTSSSSCGIGFLGKRAHAPGASYDGDGGGDEDTQLTQASPQAHRVGVEERPSPSTPKRLKADVDASEHMTKLMHYKEKIEKHANKLDKYCELFKSRRDLVNQALPQGDRNSLELPVLPHNFFTWNLSAFQLLHSLPADPSTTDDCTQSTQPSPQLQQHALQAMQHSNPKPTASRALSTPTAAKGEPCSHPANINIIHQYCPAHTRVLRSFVRKPSDPSRFATTARDGLLAFWSLQGNEGDSVTLTEDGNVDLTKRKFMKANGDGFATQSTWSHDGKVIGLAMSKCEKEPCEVILVTLQSNNQVTFRHFAEGGGKLSAIEFAPRSSTQFYTTANDTSHNLSLWTVSGEKSAKRETVHTKHTAGVQALLVEGSYVYTGGRDKRIICWDSAVQTVRWQKVMDGGVSSIQSHNTDPNLFLISQLVTRNQLCIVDFRLEQPLQNGIIMGWKQDSSLSSYNRPGWSASGNYVACGTCTTDINLWDKRKPSSILKTFSLPSGGTDGIYFDTHEDNWFVSINRDHTVGFHKLLF
ncbi:hypothetical protein Pelo_1477 [Pelomyxa schiedti]|nr:hypothetical protein Pelo_1477 [Pelomyxa schiedti]